MTESTRVHPRAGHPAEPGDLVDTGKLVEAYFDRPDPAQVEHRVAFGTSGHRGSSLRLSFNEDHILAISQAICDYRAEQRIDGPLFVGRDTHALSGPALDSALEVFAANGVSVLRDAGDGFTPTPAVSHAILRHNTGSAARADGVLITPSHNPPEDGGFKYNPPHGGPADTDVTRQVEDRANAYLAAGLEGVKRVSLESAGARGTIGRYDFLRGYTEDLGSVIDVEAIRAAGVRIGADPLGGASVGYWGEIASHYGLDIELVNPAVDPAWRFMTLDWDGKIRMDCSSPYAMASLIGARERYDVATGNDADADRHGIVTPDGGLMNPNHYLAAAIDYLFRHRSGWPASAAIGKTAVSSSMIDRVSADLGRRLFEVPVGFKWFVNGLKDGTIGFGGEESAGASFLRKDATVWTTDKDGIVLCLLAAEMTAVLGRSPSRHYSALTERFGEAWFARIDVAASREERAILGRLAPEQITATELAGDPITVKLTRAPGNDAPINGLKVCTDRGWFAARPSGTEDLYKIYAESFAGPEHLRRIQDDAIRIVSSVLKPG